MVAVTANVNTIKNQQGYWASFRQMPLVLQAYAGFSTVALVATFSLIASLFWPGAKRWMEPWAEPAFFNMYLPTFSIMLTLPTLGSLRKWLMAGLFLMLILALMMGTADTLELLSDVTVTMAAQTASEYHPIRPVLHVALPAFWFLMLLSPQVRRWMRTPSPDGPVPFALADLFYCVFVAAVCTAISVSLLGFARNRLEVGKTFAEMLAKQKAAPQASLSPSKIP